MQATLARARKHAHKFLAAPVRAAGLEALQRLEQAPAPALGRRRMRRRVLGACRMSAIGLPMHTAIRAAWKLLAARGILATADERVLAQQ
jgi:hypothetical protein